ncbi:MAG: HDOD domain-containing protein [gamma proteobacterium symbiont of Bathyaustriella thionipta]|nr:HDOD domain-containing protein [gamma proteobacterium symbiont of Bathyaustriella thionipta]MCU7950567.1 HDOD domain-containing protein [gamma proteobacterium symbiont of Bathyaustriella thionipta]MCU7954742.1 HDOD domain-containing protein [gamma proteobacterium symbiont of Bathyaustriella thionipta]MCU7957069.1 HDOD domain-containing protein [gamma proteobacterium symbiont of Bathyaustriella thionipta]MCU7967954.1 HDOD domain-containing protein [gamma proteobacterium symbiont of Bathyaustr
MINLLAYANQEINKDFDKEISQVNHAAMFLGMERLEQFIANITSLYSVTNKKIADKLSRLQHRGVHAAFQAQNFAHMINDSSVSEIYTSALVTPVSELVCWHLEPLKAQKVELLVFKEKVNYEQAQNDVFGFSYHELAETLTHHWHIPSLFLQRQEMNELDEATRSVKCLYLAEKCSIFAEQGWYYDAMYNHIKLCAETFHYSEGHIAQALHTTAVNMAQNAHEFYPVQTTISHLALLAGKVPYTPVINIEEKKKPESKADKPQPVSNKPAAKPQPEKIASIHLITSANDFPGLIRLTMDALFETRAFNRVAFMMLSKDKKQLQTRSLRGFNSKHFTDTPLSMQPANLFSKLLVKSQSVFINQLNYQKFSPLINETMQEILNVQEFIAKSVHVKGKPIGLFYMDKHPVDDSSIQKMDIEDFNQMKKICALFDQQLKNIS